MTRSAFDSSLATLRDNVVMAIERREMGVVQDGLDVYQHLIDTIFEEQLAHQSATSTTASANLPLGREWEQILRDLHGVIDSVCASTSRRRWVDVLSWVGRVAVACAARSALNAFGMIFTLFESAWEQELAAPSVDTTARQDALLLRLSEFGRLDLHPRLGRINQEAVRGVEVIYTRTFLRVLKTAIESRDPETARVGIKYFLHGSPSLRSNLSPVTGASLLALYAWILFRFDHGEADESFKAVCSQIADALEGNDALLPLLRSSDELENELGVQWWEMRERGPMSVGVIQIGNYLALALLLIAGPRLAGEQIDPSSEADVNAARRLMTAIDSWEKGGFAGSRSALGLSDTHLGSLKSHLESVVQQGDAVLEESYSRLPVDPARVTAFRSAVQSKLAAARQDSLTTALLVAPLAAVTPENPVLDSAKEPKDVEGESALSTSPEPTAPNFGLDQLIPRWFFAETRVFAEPERLADDLISGLIRGEADRILDLAVADLAHASDATFEELYSVLTSAISAEGLTDPVVVTNSYQAHTLLTGRPLANVDPLPTPFTAGPVIRVYDDRRGYLALLCAGTSPVVRLGTPIPEVDGDEVLEDLGVLVGVSELPRAEMDKIVAREVRTSIDQARLRGSLRVRLLEHLYISMNPDNSPLIWTLPESSW